MPSSLGAATMANVPSPSSAGCQEATSDESGTVAAETLAPNGLAIWQLYAGGGPTRTGSVDRISSSLFPQANGFEASRFADSDSGFISNQSVKILADGSFTAGIVLNGDENGSGIFRGWPDGMLAVTEHCGVGPPGSVDVTRFAGDGSVISRANSTGGGCAFMTAANAPGGVTLALFEGDNPSPNMTRGRWYNADGTPMGDFFTVFPNTVMSATTLSVLVNGDIALNAGGHWLGVFAANGGTTLKSVPSWLKDDHVFTIVRGERAYALIPKVAPLNHLDLVSTKGNVCGTVTFPGVFGLNTGADGTVIGAGGNDGCAKTWWSGLLK